MFPVKTIRINEGAIDYIFTVYQEIEAPLPSTDKLESALLTALRMLWGSYRRINFYVLHTPRGWRLVFTISPCSESRSISTNLVISSTEYITTGSSELGGIIAAFVSRSINELLGNQRWKITRRGNGAYTYLVEVIGGLEYIRFETDDIRTVIEYSEVSFSWRQAPVREQTWIEITATIEPSACQVSHNNLVINGLKLDAFTLGFFSYSHVIGFTIKPNIISGTIRHEPGDIITFETAPLSERAVSLENAPLSSFPLNPEGLSNFAPFSQKSAIDNKSCKYFNGSAYLKCAVNPKGACEGCKDYEPNSSNKTNT
ncbi:MAG: hypothetical protein KME29_05105 [Calothrix sp. FI2-JRJ7]|jgi:hypothetical protein|nr:hypothetical protein [Calothrix sp. FI2-JRJ7]